MKYVYFTKMLRTLDLAGMARFLTDAGLAGADFAVRPGYPVDLDNAERALPAAAKQFRDAGLEIPLATAPTNLTEPGSTEARRLFDACAAAGVGAVKIGYFTYRGDFEGGLKEARERLAGFAQLAEKTGVRALYHTHSGDYFGANCAGLRMLLENIDPHHVGAFVDTGHQTIGGASFRMNLAAVAPWFSTLAIKDVVWRQLGGKWSWSVAPAGEGLVNWGEIRQALRDRQFRGVVSLHGEYETADLTERLAKAKAELVFLRSAIGDDAKTEK